MREYLPREYLHVLLDIPWFRVREAHDNLEEVFAVGFGLGDSQGSESLEIAANAVLLFDLKAKGHQGLQEIDRIDACDKALFLLFPPDATNADAVWRSVLERDRFEVGVDRASILRPPKLYNPPLRVPFSFGPIVGH